MKKYLYMILAVVASLLFFSCETEQPTGEKYAAAPEVEIISKDDVFAAEGGNGKIEVKADGPVSAKVTGSWLAASVSGDVINLSAEANGSIESRYAILDITSGNAASSLTITQFGLTSDKVWEESYDFAYSGGSVSLSYSGSGVVHISIIEGKEWIDTDVADGKFIISTKANAYKAPREGKVSFAVGKKDAVEVGVKQAGNPTGLNPGDPEPKDFTVVDAWTPKYYGLSDTDDTKAIVGVEAAEGSSAGRYFIKVVPAAEYNAVGDQYLFLNAKVHGWLAENPTICKDSEKIEIDALTVGNYFIYAIGVNNQGAINYKYAVAPVTVTKVLSPYEKFLGTWSFPRGDAADTWTVTEKEPGKSYYITGIDAKEANIKVVAEFNAADGTVTVKSQTNLGQSTVNTSEGELTGECSLLGKIDYNGTIYRINGTYVIFTITFNEDASSAQLAPGKVNIPSLGGEFDLIGFAIYTQVGDSAYSLITGSELPNTITNLTHGEGSGGGEGGGGGGEGGGGGGGDTSGYNAWLGTWNVGSVTLTISQKTAGSTYTVSGLEEDVEFEARYANGKLEFFYQVIAASGTQEMCLYGIDDDGEGYIVTGDPANDGWLATATLNSAGTSASLVGAEFDAVYSGTTYHERIVTMQILVYDDSDGNFYYVSDEHPQIDMPTTMTKASTSAVSCRARNSVELSTGVVKATPAIFSVGQKAVAARKR